MKNILATMMLIGCITPVLANTEVDIADKFYFGAGIAGNDLRGDDATGFQFFAGYPLQAKLGKGDLAIEAGYMDSGSFERRGNFGSVSTTGLWGTLVGRWNVATKTDLVVRAGLDVGDDDGMMFGVGLGYALSKKLELRGEYVKRDNIDSLQFNFVFR